MVKRSKLTLNHTEVKEEENPEMVVSDEAVVSDTQNHFGKILILTGITIVALIIFRQKIF